MLNLLFDFGHNNIKYVYLKFFTFNELMFKRNLKCNYFQMFKVDFICLSPKINQKSLKTWKNFQKRNKNKKQREKFR
jgi:hypothetical protein